MNTIPLLLSAVLTATPQNPGITQPDLQDLETQGTAWSRVVERSRRGTHRALGYPVPAALITESKVTDPETGVMRHRYLTAMGAGDSAEDFGLAWVSMVDETWTPVGDRLHVEQWIIDARPHGPVFQRLHRRLVMDDTGRVYDTIGLPDGEEEVRKAWARMVAFWDGFEPGAAAASPARRTVSDVDTPLLRLCGGFYYTEVRKLCLDATGGLPIDERIIEAADERFIHIDSITAVLSAAAGREYSGGEIRRCFRRDEAFEIAACLRS